MVTYRLLSLDISHVFPIHLSSLKTVCSPGVLRRVAAKVTGDPGNPKPYFISNQKALPFQWNVLPFLPLDVRLAEARRYLSHGLNLGWTGPIWGLYRVFGGI